MVTSRPTSRLTSSRRRRDRSPSRATPRVLIIVQNLPVPFDRRVWLESQALRADGVDVTVVCPKGPGDPSRQEIDGVKILKYRPFAPGGSAVGFVLEYLYSFGATAWLTLRARADGRFQVVQACNPPDIFWPIGRVLRAVDRTRFVFDHHDLCPELFESRFPGGSRLAHRGLLLLERATFSAADQVISTNDSYAAVARSRGRKTRDQVTVVRTGPDDQRLVRGPEVADRRRGRKHLVAYIGVMGPQDGVDIAIRAAHHVVKVLGRTDISFTLMGAGDSYESLLKLRDELGVRDFVEMPGRVPDETVDEVLSTADVGLSPDPKNPLNDVSTMNKTMEYMAYGLPVVAFDLRETEVSAGDAGVYVTDNDVAAYARALVDLLDDYERRVTMGKVARRRVEDVLAWRHQESVYVQTYRRLLGRSSDREPATPPLPSSVA
jgi:glycosyltransferase involved in cell wall biosynthesis